MARTACIDRRDAHDARRRDRLARAEREGRTARAIRAAWRRQRQSGRIHATL